MALVPREPVDHLDSEDHLVREENQDPVDPLEPQVELDHLDREESGVMQVNLVVLVRMDLKDLLV